MTTNVQMYRKFERGPTGEITKRETPIPPADKITAICPLCGEDMIMNIGQRMYAHKACKKKKKWGG